MVQEEGEIQMISSIDVTLLELEKSEVIESWFLQSGEVITEQSTILRPGKNTRNWDQHPKQLAPKGSHRGRIEA